ncbi:MAG: glycoside hydrolase family 3 C-terminal domain-containing protein, partial [Thermoproteota archaeon]
ALFGTGQIETIKGGTGSGDTHPRYVIPILDGMRERRLRIDEELVEVHTRYLAEIRNKDEYRIEKTMFGEIFKPVPQDFLSEDEIGRFAERNEVAVIVISRISGEGYDRKPEKGDFYLSDDERRLLERVSKAFHERGKKVVAILNIGSPIEVASWRNMVDGILLAWQAGQEAGRIVADIVSGERNPSGKLPTTFPMGYSDVPSWSFPGEPRDNPQRVVYEEGIYVGYRYYDTFGVEPAYEFGFGLSYTSFEYRNLKVETVNNRVIVYFEVENTGRIPGKEVAQIYVRAPKVRIEKPFHELKGFHKTRLLNPGEKERITVELDFNSLASYDGEEWVVEKGEYEVRVGASSRDIRLVGRFTVN